MKAIVCSIKDMAGMNMFDKFLHKGFETTDSTWEGMPVFQKDNLLLVRTNHDLIYADNLNDLDADEIIFASRHKSASGDPTLTAHVPGNFGTADLGGEPGKLCYGAANTMRNIYLEIVKYEGGDYKVSLECSHHGPLISQPCCFIELGSSERQWKDKKAAEFLVDCILKGLEKQDKTQTAIGIGGGHYCPTFSGLEKKYAFGHILPKYAQKYLNLEMVKQMMEKTAPPATKIFIDKKGTKAQAEVRKMLEGYEVELL